MGIRASGDHYSQPGLRAKAFPEAGWHKLDARRIPELMSPGVDDLSERGVLV
jgi:hypothetical protein